MKEEEYWEDETFNPILITIEEVQYKGKSMISYQAAFEVLDEFDDIDGDEWEGILREYVREKAPDLETKIHGDSESSTCVVWLENEADFKKTLGLMIELLRSEEDIERIRN
ncbi:MAG: hypothetical protein IPM82_32085 [Saprospiraceae bacterium]|nr:hypothetical protein [Saprospiraceae bacterium]